MYARPVMPSSVTTSISTSGAEGMAPDAVLIGGASGAFTAVARRSRTVRALSLTAGLPLRPGPAQSLAEKAA
ncbi:MAG: hypothetical protein Kow00114_19590 [Kiloniellaceae bacterium]